jgi:hypothetical protein
MADGSYDRQKEARFSENDIWRKSGPQKSTREAAPLAAPALEQGEAFGRHLSLGAIVIDDAAKKAGKVSFKVESPVTLPGIPMHFVLQNRWEGADPRNLAPTDGSPGLYQVSFLLTQLERIGAQDGIDSDEGDSCVWLPQSGGKEARTNVPILRVLHGSASTGIMLEGYANRQGRLARLVARTVQANSFSDAELKANRAVQGFLSQMSVRFNIPIIIGKTHIVEIATANQQIEIVTPFGGQYFGSNLTLHAVDGFQVYSSLYREALNSNSPVYRFLCFYKIIEALRIRRNRLAADRRRNGETPSRIRGELLPPDKAAATVWLRQLFELGNDSGEMSSSYVFPLGTFGLKFNRVINSALTPLRVSIAHAVLETGETTLIAHELLHMKKVMLWLPLTNCIARQMLKTDFPSAFEGLGIDL